MKTTALKQIYLSIIFLGTISFNTSCQNSAIQGAKNDNIVIIFKQVQNYDSIINRYGKYYINKPIINYLYEFYQEKQIAIANKDKPDTLSIKCSENNIVIGIRYFEVDWIYFLLKKGDTVEVSYKNDFPFCNITNRKISEYNINYQYFKRKRFGQSSPQSQFYYSTSEIKPDPSFYYTSRYKDLLQEINYIDSLKTKKLLNEEYAAFNLSNSRYSFLSISRRAVPDHEKLASQIHIEDSDFKHENLLNNRNYLWFLRTYVNERFSKKDYKQFDSRIIYDSIKQSNLFSPKIKSFLLTDYFASICESGTVDDIQSYFKSYTNSVVDSSLINYLNLKYHIDKLNQKTEIDDLLLVNNLEKNTTLKTILSNEKGKIVVIDFWASWCGPCRQQMPLMKELEEKYKNDDVVFVFLSIDRDRNLWLKAFNEEKMINSEYSYLVLPSKTNFMNNIALKAIPRSVIFDKNGNLVCKDAPRPDSPLLSEMIKNYLNK